ncbi:DNA primase [Halobacillus andaensis]|uniref:DNA primase n=1 Tax=Halobacillus andaensis TaxID=1176239 RepID=A0A917AZ64_HALAA|nr:DNA primase [Halobacillus andaensis]MBP2003063.1 DNA primase [Halobacillus andaensis]GGF07753.1 DNA primase [Halobacillus andaensis]
MAGHIPEEKVDEIRKSVDIADVVGEYVQLKRQGRNYFGLCPFHGENTPSFSVSSDKQIFHCFGCGKGGNVYSFLMEIEGYSFLQAVQRVAEKTGHSLPEQFNEMPVQQTDPESQSILDAHEWMTKLYHHMLRNSKEGKNALQYLLDRGFTEETIQKYQLGFSPTSPTFVATFLEKKGFHPQTMVKAGLLNANEKGEYFDRFRGRIMFPLRNHLGKTVAFAGRSLGDQEPKYLNSPETDLFQKGRLLFNFDLARSSIRKSKTMVLFEGYADVLSADQAGIGNGVATMGTSISETQAQLIKRYADRVIVCYDGDDAGTTAAAKAAKLLKQTGCQTNVARLPEGLDPDDYIKKFGGDRFEREVIEASDPYTSFIINFLRRNYNLQLEGDRIAYIEKVLQEIAQLERAIEREHYLKALAEEFQMSIDTLKSEVEHLKAQSNAKPLQTYERRQQQSAPVKRNSTHRKLLPAFHNAERKLIANMLKNPVIADKVQEELGGAFNISEHQVIVTHLYAYYEDGHEPNVSQFIERLEDQSLKDLVIQLTMSSGMDEEMSDQEISDYLHRIRSENTDRNDIKSLEAEQKKAEQHNDPIKAAEIAMEILRRKQELKNTH